VTAGITRATVLSTFAALEAAGAIGDPLWLRDLRRAAVGRFAEQGLPTSRDEEWKYTSLAPISATDFAWQVDEADGDLTEETVAPFRLGPAWSGLVFVNGRYAAKLSTVGVVPPGVRIGSLRDAVITDTELVRPAIVAASTEEPPDAFGALNAAFWLDGAFVHVPAGVSIAEPIYLLFVATAPRPPRVDHLRSLLVLEPGSAATVVETYVTLAANPHLTNTVTDIVVGTGAGLDRYKVQLEDRHAFHIGRTRVREARDSHVRSCAVTFGGRLTRNDVRVHLGAETARCELSGLHVIGGRQHVDTHTVIDHAAAQATSRQLYKGILDGRARGVFSGRVVVRPGAQGTDAYQLNKNLLLSDEVEVDSRPQLEIFADDVKCSHGAADGQIAEDALFYLKSRGLGEHTARALLAFGFANEVLGKVRVAPLRAWLEGRLTARLDRGRVAEEEPEDAATRGPGEKDGR
jgi:Fe-S cluster assembly protein SufD